MIKLTEEQQKHYDSIKWLFNTNPRAIGRTTLLIKVLVDLALEGQEVYLEDFSQMPFSGHNAMMRNRFISQVEIYLNTNKINDLEIKMNTCTMRRTRR